MAQTEDTELRDLVIEALEKNGSLAKIRALLRANIFLAFEDECENMRHNMILDSLLKRPEGIYALSIIHEFLEFCNLKNTLFVYKAESRQGKDYKYDGKKVLYDKLKLSKQANDNEPMLITLIKNFLKISHNHNDNIHNNRQDCGDNVCKDHNSSYIVHEDSQSSATNTSQSDNSIDEKNKLHLRLHLDNSDTDTSSDSSRGKSASEYVPSEHIIEAQSIARESPRNSCTKIDNSPRQDLNLPNYFSKVAGNTSSESTSYVELKPFSSIDEKMLNTSGLPTADMNDLPVEQISKNNSDNSKQELSKSATLSSLSSLSLKNDNQKIDIAKKLSQKSSKSDGETADYSYDFSSSHGSHCKENSNKKSPDSPKDFIIETNKGSPIASPHQNSHSSISISDVADLITDNSSSFDHQDKSNKKSPNTSNFSKKSMKMSPHLSNKLNSDDSGDFTESPVPSLSNLSLDIHSD